MLVEGAAALVAAAGSGLVTAMVTDAWQETRMRVAQLLGRGDTNEVARQEGRLDRARAEVIEASGEQVELVREEQAAAWRTRFADLLEESPEVQEQVRELVTFLTDRVGNTVAGAVQVNAYASDQAQQAVQGQGTQHVTFHQSSGPQ